MTRLNSERSTVVTCLHHEDCPCYLPYLMGSLQSNCTTILHPMFTCDIDSVFQQKYWTPCSTIQTPKYSWHQFSQLQVRYIFMQKLSFERTQRPSKLSNRGLPDNLVIKQAVISCPFDKLLPQTDNWLGEWFDWKSLLECDKCEAVSSA
jgi:hypothetical protein